MAKKIRACKKCKTIYEEGDKCPKCGSTGFTENWRGRIEIVDPNQSEIAKKLKLPEKGIYAVKTD